MGEPKAAMGPDRTAATWGTRRGPWSCPPSAGVLCPASSWGGGSTAATASARGFPRCLSSPPSPSPKAPLCIPSKTTPCQKIASSQRLVGMAGVERSVLATHTKQHLLPTPSLVRHVCCPHGWTPGVSPFQIMSPETQAPMTRQVDLEAFVSQESAGTPALPPSPGMWIESDMQYGGALVFGSSEKFWQNPCIPQPKS